MVLREKTPEGEYKPLARRKVGKMRKSTARNRQVERTRIRKYSLTFPEWMDLRALTQYATVSERTLRKWIHAAQLGLPAIRRDGKILVNRRTFDAWLLAHPVKPRETPLTHEHEARLKSEGHT